MYQVELTERGEEVVLRYEENTEVVLRYAQTFPLTRSPILEKEELRQSLQKRKKERRLRRLRHWTLAVCILCASLVLSYTVAAFLFPKTVSVPWIKQKAAFCAIPTYEGARSEQLSFSENTGEILSPGDIYRKVNPAVVAVMGGAGKGTNIGTGVICTPDGIVVTNAHIIENCSVCTVLSADGLLYPAALMGYDSSEDLAVLKIEDSYRNFPTVELASSDTLSIGDTVYAIGNPLGLKLRGSFTGGMVSGLNREIKVEGEMLTLIQTDAALNNGNSGGPLINSCGQVVGINTAKMKSASLAEGLNLAIPLSDALRKINDLIRVGEIQPAPLIGITVASLTENTADGHQGLLVIEPPTPGGSGEMAGLCFGDILISVDGMTLHDNQDLLAVRDAHHVGDTLSFEVCRRGEHFTVNLILQGDR